MRAHGCQGCCLWPHQDSGQHRHEAIVLQALESWGSFPSISIANSVGIADLAGIALRGQATDSQVQIPPCSLAPILAVS